MPEGATASRLRWPVPTDAPGARCLKCAVAAIAMALGVWPSKGLSQEECVIPPSFAATRPAPEAGPTAVRVGVYVIDVTHVQEVEKTFTGDVHFSLRWEDPRLSADALGRSLAGCPLELDDIWDPAVLIVNLRSADRIESPLLSVDESGNVLYRERFYGTFTASLDLHDFPFDQQVLPITTVARSSPEEVVLRADSTRLGMVDSLSISGWSVRQGEVSAEAFAVPGLGVSLPRFEQRLLARRDSAFWLLRALLPLGIVLLMASVVFWIDPIVYPRQVGFAFTSILTLIAYQFSISISMPEISYLTRFDRFIIGASLLVLLTALEAVVAGSLANGGRVEAARRMNRWARWIYLVAVLVLGFLTLRV